MPKILISKTFSFFIFFIVLLLTNGTTYQGLSGSLLHTYNASIAFSLLKAYTFCIMEDELQITLTNDYAFKRLLGSEDNKPLLRDLLECILDLSPEDVSELELMDKELTKEELSEKTGILAE